MGGKTKTQYIPITIDFYGVTLWGLFAPPGYYRLSGLRVTEYPKGIHLPENGVKPTKLRLNGIHMPPDVIATSAFFRDVEHLKETGRINRILQIDGWLAITDNYSALLMD